MASQSRVDTSNGAAVESPCSLSELCRANPDLCVIEETHVERGSGTDSPVNHGTHTASVSSSPSPKQNPQDDRQNTQTTGKPSAVHESGPSESGYTRCCTPKHQTLNGGGTSPSPGTNSQIKVAAARNSLQADQFPVGYKTSHPFDGGEWADFHVRSMASSVCDREGYDNSGASDDEDDMVCVTCSTLLCI